MRPQLSSLPPAPPFSDSLPTVFHSMDFQEVGEERRKEKVYGDFCHIILITLGSLFPSMRLVKLPLTLMGVTGAHEGKGDPHRVQDASLPRRAS